MKMTTPISFWIVLKRELIDIVHYQYKDPNSCRDNNHGDRIDMDRPLVLALIIIDESCGGYQPSTLLLCHTKLFLSLHI